MDKSYTKVVSTKIQGLALKVLPGHFKAGQAHVNAYLDMTDLKTGESETRALGTWLAKQYTPSTLIDTIVCLEDTDRVGACLTEALIKAGFQSMDLHKTIYTAHPQRDEKGELTIPKDQQHMIMDKHVLVLFSVIASGQAAEQDLECLRRDGAQISAIASLFSELSSLEGISVTTAFDAADLPFYSVYAQEDCPYCQTGVKLLGEIAPDGSLRG